MALSINPDYLDQRASFVGTLRPLFVRHGRVPLIVDEVVIHAAGRDEYIAEETRDRWMEFGATPKAALDCLRQEMESVLGE